MSESFGACLLLSIPEDVFAVISRSLSPTDICNLGLTCKSLCDHVDSEKIWLVQCEIQKVLPLSEIIQWRVGIGSYKVLCRFLVEVIKPLAGIWVGQNPELGNVVYVMPGFLSVVGCRIIPQKVGPLDIEEGRVSWSPVFEIICSFDGSTKFFLHGRDREGSCIYPGSVTGIEKSCNVLLLEVKPRLEKREASREVPFGELEFSDKRKLLGIVTNHVGLHVVEPLSEKLFPCSNDDDESTMLERRTMLLKMHMFGERWKNMNLEEEWLCYDPSQVDITEKWENLDDVVDDTDDIDESSEIVHSVHQKFLSSGDTFGIGLKASYNEMSSYVGWPIMPKERYALYKLPIQNPLADKCYDDDDDQIQGKKRKSFSKYIKSGIKHILGKSSSSKNTCSHSETKRMNRQSFLSSLRLNGLSLKASSTKMIQSPLDSEHYVGLWGGTFGWPPGRCIEDKPEKSFYLLMLSYNESEENSDERVLIGTKILCNYADHPNGSAMFVANIDTPSLERFPFDADGINFEHSYTGQGIADGYGFRYPGSKPGSLFVFSNDHIAFVWQETIDVLTLQRLNLEEILKKGLGLCMPPLPPTKNFAYMERSCINVFTRSSTDY